MYLLGLNFIINSPFGELSESKISALKKSLNLFPEFQTISPAIIGFKNANQGIQIDTMNNIIAYFFNGDSKDINFTQVEEALKQVFDIFEKKYEGSLGVNFHAISNKSFDVKEKSKVKFLDYASVDPSIYGVGIRLLTMSDEFSGEIKVEPYIHESSQVFIFGNSQSKQLLEFTSEKFESELTNMISIAEKIDNLMFN